MWGFGTQSCETFSGQRQKKTWPLRFKSGQKKSHFTGFLPSANKKKR
jgi:hypothetical protein